MIDQSTIEEIRRRVLLSSVVAERVKLTRRGRSLLGLCPFHKEKTPSFQVNDERGFYHCFGCSASGDVVSFLRETEGLSFVEAISALAERAGIQITDQRSDGERKEAHAAQRQKDVLFEINDAAARYFERCMAEHPLAEHARQALVQRGLDPGSPDEAVQGALREFRIGYAPYGWDGLTEHLRQAGQNLQAAERVGLLVPRKTGSGYYDRFRHRLMFAVRDLRGRTIAFSGRTLSAPSDAELHALSHPPPGQAQEEAAKYVNSPESAIYRKRETLFGLYQARQAIRDLDCCVVVEGNFDVVSLHARGLRHVVAPLGTAFTAEQAQEIKRFSQQVILLFDSDKAGQRATKNAREPCREQGLLAKVASLPEGSDPDDFIRSHGREALEQRIKAARSMLEYLIDSALDQRFAAADAQARAARIKEVTDLITSENDPTVRAMAKKYADQIAGRLNIADIRTLDALRGSVTSATRSSAALTAKEPRAAPPETARSRPRDADIEREMLAALLEFPELLDDASLSDALSHAEGDVAVAIATLHRSRASAEGPLELLERLPAELRDFAARRLASPELADSNAAREVLVHNAKKVLRLSDKQHGRDVIEKLHAATASGDVATQTALLAERMERARARRGLKE